MNEKTFDRAPSATAIPMIAAEVTAAPVTTVATRRPAITSAASSAAGHTLIQVATVNSTEASRGRVARARTPRTAIGVATESIRATATGPRQAVTATHHQASRMLRRATNTSATPSSRVTSSNQVSPYFGSPSTDAASIGTSAPIGYTQ